MKKYFFIAMSCINLYSQQNIQLGYQSMYGGPVPEEKIDSSSGKVYLTHRIFATYSNTINNKLGFDISLGFETKKLDYAFQFVSDTTMSNPPLSFTIPYLGDVKGTSTTKSLNISAGLNYNLFNSKLNIGIGPELNYVINKIDTGTTLINIGEGAIIIDSANNNSAFINNLNWGLYLRTKYYISKRIGVVFDVSRSLTPFYKDGMWSRIKRKEVYFYNTYIKLGLFINF